MGGYSSTPVALDELTQPYIVTPRLSRELYRRHVQGETIDTALLSAMDNRDLLLQVPPELLGKVSLHKSLDLSFNLITEIPPDLPLNLPHLTVLNLSHNKISKIPDSLFGFIHLRLLDLSFNKIDNVPSTISLFHDLRKLDLSHNEISKIPSSISNLKRLEKLNVSHNKLEHLPLSLGNMPSLQVVLATANPLQQGLQEGWEEAGSGPLLAFLRRCYAGSVPALPADHISLGNAWSRVRGPVFDSSVLNSGSAQSLFEQMQAQAVNTGNRLLTPLIPPVKATKLPVDKLRDSILGLFYGAAIGDSLGVLTDGMTADEAEFHYCRKLLDQTHLYRDQARSEAVAGAVSPGAGLALAMLDSVMTWAGVVDELDYAARLVTWYTEHKDQVTSNVLHGLLTDKESFLSSPASAARMFYENNTEYFTKEHLDNSCLPAMIAIAVTQFHNLTEVQDNARRICSSTHCSEHHCSVSATFATILATVLQGSSVADLVSAERRDPATTRNSVDTALLHLHPRHTEPWFRDCLTSVVMAGGQASLNGLVAGAVYGALQGYHALPAQWIANIDRNFVMTLDKKINLLLDLMGVP